MAPTLGKAAVAKGLGLVAGAGVAGLGIPVLPLVAGLSVIGLGAASLWMCHKAGIFKPWE